MDLRQEIAGIVQRALSRGTVTQFTQQSYGEIIGEAADAILAIPEIKDALDARDDVVHVSREEIAKLQRQRNEQMRRLIDPNSIGAID